MKTKDFQEATAQRIFKLFSEKNQKRVMLSDEVGLGKTIVASRVVDLVKQWHEKLGDKSFRVVYICSNLAISKSNTIKLGIEEKDQVDFRNSRLSMAHLEISKRLKRHASGDNQMFDLIIPLTPSTSFSLTNSAGNMDERALMYLHLSNLYRLAAYKDLLYANFECNVNDWDKVVKRYTDEIQKCEISYMNDIKMKLTELMQDEDYENLIEMLEKRSCGQSYYKIMNRIRKIFAQVSISMLEPDLVIMDEFQRFSSLININNENPSEQAMLFDRLLKSSSVLNGKMEEPNILLLSATPYKMYSTLEELNIEGVDTSLNEFMTVAKFLNYSESGFKKFSDSWNGYCRALASGSSMDKKLLFQSTKDAEEALYNVMCRTERPNMGIINTDGVKEIKIEESDITSFVQMQDILDNALKQRNAKISRRNIPIEYVKSSPYLLSFMENYTLKKDLKAYIVKYPNIVSNKKSTLIPFNKVYYFKDIDPGNAKLRMMYDMLFSDKDKKEYQLLWVPASHTYYKTDGVFEKNTNFSKILVFSAWEMVPRMLAVMLSYYSEQKNVSILKTRKKNDTKVSKINYFNVVKFYQNRIKSVSDDDQTKENILSYACKTLADFYNPKYYMGWRLEDILKDIKDKITKRLVLDNYEISKALRFGSSQMIKVMKQLDGDCQEISSITENAVNVMVMLAIASPAICIFRTLESYGFNDEHIIQNSSSGASAIVKIFNSPEAVMIIDSIYAKKDEYYYESVLDYCMKGNLQAVLDEYQFTLQNKPIHKALETCVIDTRTLDVETVASIRSTTNGNKGNATDIGNKKLKMRCNFAVTYVDKMTSDSKEKSISNKQDAFNSPFRPFVMSTTSVGQEGLDFHQYARKIVHWNLPSNPVDLEQREGRINRFGCLAVRRNVAKLFSEHYSWKEMFDCASNRLKSRLSDMVPFWCLPIERLTDDEKRRLEYIERIVPLYPFSRDKNRYDQLINVLSMYRMTMGMPRQEELLDLLSQMNLDESDVNNLTLNLCPFDKI